MTHTAAEEHASTTPAVAPQRVALKQRAYDELKRLILSGELAAGTVQSVRQLAAQLDMSKTPVHAAIERLEAEGLVTLAPQQGVVVRELSVRDIVSHYEIRQALEPFVMRRLAGRLTASQIDLLRENQVRHRDLAEQNAALGRVLPATKVLPEPGPPARKTALKIPGSWTPSSKNSRKDFIVMSGLF